MHIGFRIHSFRVYIFKAFKISAFVAGLFASTQTLAQASDDVLSKMTLAQKVGQLFIFTYPGKTASAEGKALYEKYQPGALIVFGANISSVDQIGHLNSELQDLASRKMKAPLFLMIDQEGGAVTRLRSSVPLPSALALGRMKDNEFVHSFARAKAEVLRAAGFNVNLAPVLDIADSNRDSFIGNRAFGDDPDQVTETAIAYAEGIHDSGVMPTAKHFPGYGGLTQDTHHRLVKKMSTPDELEDRDLVPFEEFAQSDFPRAVMMAHLSLPKVDPSGMPATYSKVLIQTYLREKLKYDGLIITDDLEMTGASIEKDIGARAVRAVLAGDDMLLIAGLPSHQKRAFETVLNAVKIGRISESRLNASVKRILNYKAELKLGRFNYDSAATHSLSAKLDDLSRQVLKRNFQLSLKGQVDRWPAVSGKTRTLVLSSDRSFFQKFAKDFQGKKAFYHLTPKSIAHAHEAMKNYDLIVFYASGIQTAHWLNTLDPKLRAKTLVVNSNNSGEIEAQGSFLSVLNINSVYPECGEALSHAMNPGANANRVPASVINEK